MPGRGRPHQCRGPHWGRQDIRRSHGAGDSDQRRLPRQGRDLTAMQVVLLSTDLMVVSRVQGAAARTGASVRVAADVPAAAKLHGDLPADLVIADLATSPLAIDSLISQLKANAKPPARVVAFGP